MYYSEVQGLDDNPVVLVVSPSPVWYMYTQKDKSIVNLRDLFVSWLSLTVHINGELIGVTPRSGYPFSLVINKTRKDSEDLDSTRDTRSQKEGGDDFLGVQGKVTDM